MKKYNEKEYGLFKAYAGLTKVCKTISEREKYYLNIRKKYPNFFEYVELNNPFEIVLPCIKRDENKKDVYRKVGQYRFWFNQRTVKKDVLPPLERCFDSESNIELEEAIQRNIAYSNEQKGFYEKSIGKVVGYEVNIPHVDFKLAGIDLISIKDECLYLIELKRCNVLSESPENKEQLIRALFEISTYYSYVKYARLNDSGAFDEAVMNRTNLSFKTIKRVIIAPKNILDDIKFYTEEDRKYIAENFIFFSISARKPLANLKVKDCSEELFNIEPYEVN